MLLVVCCWSGWILLFGLALWIYLLDLLVELVGDVLVRGCVVDGFIFGRVGWMCSKELGA